MRYSSTLPGLHFSPGPGTTREDAWPCRLLTRMVVHFILNAVVVSPPSRYLSLSPFVQSPYPSRLVLVLQSSRSDQLLFHDRKFRVFHTLVHCVNRLRYCLPVAIA